MSWQLYAGLSAMMFFEFAVWGMWAPVLAARLLGPLKMTARQLGWIYGMMPLACIVAPLAAGQLVDRWVPTEWYLGVAHLVGGVLLLAAARTTRFLPLLVLMGLYSLCFAPTLALVNSLTFTHLPNPEVNYFWVRVWGAVSWVLAGWGLTAWRRSGKFQVRGADSLTLAGILALAMGVYCFFLPHTPPAHKAGAVVPFIQALSLLGDPNFSLFLVLSFIVTTQLQFYFLGTARFLEDIGTSHTAIPAAMSIAQGRAGGGHGGNSSLHLSAAGIPVDARHGYRVLDCHVPDVPPHAAAPADHRVYDAAWPGIRLLLRRRVPLHRARRPSEIRGSAQGLYTTVTLGLGLFAGTD